MFEKDVYNIRENDIIVCFGDESKKRVEYFKKVFKYLIEIYFILEIIECYEINVNGVWLIDFYIWRLNVIMRVYFW